MLMLMTTTTMMMMVYVDGRKHKVRDVWTLG